MSWSDLGLSGVLGGEYAKNMYLVRDYPWQGRGTESERFDGLA